MPERDSLLRGGLVRRERRLPLPGEVLVAVGDAVEPDTVVARVEAVPGDPYVVDLAAELKVRRMAPEDLERALLVRQGDRVDAGQPIARLVGGYWGEERTAAAPVAGQVEFVSLSTARVLIREDARSAEPMVVVNVARELDIWPALIRAHMRYEEGQYVERGAVLAASSGVFGMDYAYAPASGRIERIDAHTGAVYISRPSRITQVDAFLRGRVERLLADEGAVIAAEAVQMSGVFGIGGEVHGELVLRVEGPEEALDPASVDAFVAGRIVVGGAGADAAGLRRLVEAGARGLIVGGVDQKELVTFLGRELPPVTGREDAGLTVVLTEGFGRLAMNPWLFQALRRGAGDVASMSGETQVRAGAVRPEIILPVPDGAEQAGAVVRGGVPEVGARVRVMSRRRFGAWGTVAALPDAPQALPSGIRTAVAQVRLDDGDIVTVARTNLEVYEA